MLTLRQEAIKIVNEIPDDSLSEFVNIISVLKNRFVKKKEQKTSKNKSESIYTTEEIKTLLKTDPNIDPKKAAAFAAIEEWQKNNKAFLTSNIDWEQERAAAMEEKYGSFN